MEKDKAKTPKSRENNQGSAKKEIEASPDSKNKKNSRQSPDLEKPLRGVRPLRVERPLQEVRPLHIHIHFDKLDTAAAKNIAINLAIDWKGTDQRIRHIKDEISLWERRIESLIPSEEAGFTQDLTITVENKLDLLNTQLDELLGYQKKLKQEIEIMQTFDSRETAHPEGGEYSLNKESVEQRRFQVRSLLESLLDKDINEILLEEKFLKQKRDKKVDEELTKLKAQMKNSKIR